MNSTMLHADTVSHRCRVHQGGEWIDEVGLDTSTYNRRGSTDVFAFEELNSNTERKFVSSVDIEAQISTQ